MHLLGYSPRCCVKDARSRRHWARTPRTPAPSRRQVNMLATRKREHSRKPDEQYGLIEACSPGPHLELFGRGTRPNWTVWGNQASDDYRPDWDTYAYNSGTLAAE